MAVTTDEATIAIVGAGFSGTVTAAHLLRLGIDRPCRIVLINRSGAMARGVAYGTRSSWHVLNVPAGRMSAFPDAEGDFLEFVRRRDPETPSGAFVPRAWYGEYLEHILERARGVAKSSRLEQRVAEVTRILPLEHGRARLDLSAGQPLEADHVVIALGNFAPADPVALPPDVLGSSRYVRDPWQPSAFDGIAPRAPVLLVGTGLTMVDVALSLERRGVGRMTAISRRGLLPHAHRSPSLPPARDHLPPGIDSVPPTALSLLRAVRDHVRAVQSAGVDWRDVLASLRPITPALWHRMPQRERARFLRHVRPYWEAHRHRAAPELIAGVFELIRDRRLDVRAGRLIGAVLEPSALRVSVRSRGGGAEWTRDVAAVVNCTGPSSDLARGDERLIVALIGDGVARADPLGLGLDCAPNGAVIAKDGSASAIVSLVGPLLRARDWEATAVPELRVHAARLAERIAAELGLAGTSQTKDV